MKERPILFSAPMARAILDGRKTQTRRIINPQPEQLMLSDAEGTKRLHWCIDHSDPKKRAAWPFGDPPFWTNCPYGGQSDRLWVRETWRTDELSPNLVDGVRYAADGAFIEIENTREAAELWLAAYDNGRHKGMWRPSIFMPRWASRITLEITDVRIERLQDISEEDAQAEGSQIPIGELSGSARRAAWNERQAFSHILESINGEGAWNANPWVWALTFKRVTA